MNMKNSPINEKGPHRPVGKGRLSARFRNINIMLFALAFCIMLIVMLVAFKGVIHKLSSAYAGRYAASTAEALSTYVDKEMRLVAKAAHSNAVIDWVLDENNDAKRAIAYEELASIVGELYSFNLYIILESSLHEYKVDKTNTVDNFQLHSTLDKNNIIDTWYFECIASDSNYVLTVGMDHIMQRKRVWLNYKVVKDGVPLGVLCTGLEFSHVAGELFSKYDSNNMRGFIIDGSGIIHMDSSLMSNKDFLYKDYETHIESEFSDPAILTVLRSHLNGIQGYYEGMDVPPAIIEISSGPYSYMTVAPIRFTNWSAVIFSGTPPLFDMSLFVSVSVTMLVIFIAFAVIASAMTYRLIFLPLSKLDRSLLLLRENHEEFIYGTDRDDELGDLANTIQDLFTKANVDALTGIYNRRFMENNLESIMNFSSRSKGMLSVVMLDVDYFKKYNDTYGHEQGDICLKAIAQSLAGSITRANDFAARYGGEEFVAVLPNTDETGARVVVEKLIENVRALNIPHAASDTAPYVTISIGVTTGRVTFSQSGEDYLRRADEALYMSKHNGRNQYTHLMLLEKQEEN